MCLKYFVIHLNTISLVYLLSLFGELILIWMIKEKLQLFIRKCITSICVLGWLWSIILFKKNNCPHLHVEHFQVPSSSSHQKSYIYIYFRILMLMQAPLLGETEWIHFLSKIQDFMPPVRTHAMRRAGTVYDRCKLHSTSFAVCNL